MRKFLEIVIGIPVALAIGLGYGAFSYTVTKGREPWYTFVMLLCLWVTACVMKWLCGSPWTVVASVYVFGGVLFVALRLLFGQGSAHEVMVSAHVLVVLALMLYSMHERVEKRKRRSVEHSASISMKNGQGKLSQEPSTYSVNIAFKKV